MFEDIVSNCKCFGNTCGHVNDMKAWTYLLLSVDLREEVVCEFCKEVETIFVIWKHNASNTQLSFLRRS